MISPTLLLATASAVANVALVAGAGAWLGRRGILNDAANNTLSRLVFSLMLPCLLFTKISASLTLESVRVMWILPVLALLHVVMGFGLGKVVAWLGLALSLVVIAACFQLDLLMLIALAVTFALCIFNFLLRTRRSPAIEVPDHA